MTIFSQWYLIALLAIMIAVHAAAAFIGDNFAIYANSANIGLHILGIFLLMLAKAPLEEAVLFYMISVFSYTLFFYIKHAFAMRAKAEDCEPCAASQAEDATDGISAADNGEGEI